MSGAAVVIENEIKGENDVSFHTTEEPKGLELEVEVIEEVVEKSLKTTADLTKKGKSVNTIYRKIYDMFKKTFSVAVIIGLIYIIQEFVRAYYTQDFTRLNYAFFKALAIKSGIVKNMTAANAKIFINFLRDTFFKYAEIFVKALTTGVNKVKTLF